MKNTCTRQSSNIGLYKENMHWRLFVLWSSQLLDLLFLHSLQLRLASVVVGLSACKVRGHLGWEEWALNDRKIPHTFSTRYTQNNDLSCGCSPTAGISHLKETLHQKKHIASCAKLH